ncbi:MAG: aquaporin family protein [Chloroflexi bacterium]|nr:aquaporin family protein [Chloroflexota bacterium]MCI0575333.1 aquaporin family protein [Chloroflexota bacterium]MCI0647324.1 aquaporin family protein [Chloroflexota bacterium]MCI0725791.1 aquaporin family protein [Chloroflexota bacterium]
MSSQFLGELFGTMFLIILGDGVVAAVLLNKSKAQNSGWIVITTGWAFAVMVGVFVSGAFGSGFAHINPAVTIAFAVAGRFDWADVPIFIVAQVIGAFLGGVIVWLAYLPHWGETPEQGLKLAVFSTGPAIRNTVTNLITEVIGTMVLVLGVFSIFSSGATAMATGGIPAAGLGPLLVGALVWGIGLSLGGPTGYAINPARDLGPRIAHQLLPIAGKGASDWAYGWIPVAGPIIGGILAGIFPLIFAMFG